MVNQTGNYCQPACWRSSGRRYRIERIVAGMGEGPKQPAKRGLTWPVKLFLAFPLLVMLGGVVLTAAAFVPTRLAPLAREYPLIEDRSGRVPKKGCSLTEVETQPGTCGAVTVTRVREEDVTFPSRLTEKGLARLQGTVTIPETAAGRRPAVVLIGGSGPTPRDSTSKGDLVHTLSAPFPLMKELAAHLGRLGFVVLRFDKRSCVRCYAGYRPDFKQFLFSDNVDDAKDALAYLASRPEVDPRALVVAGHSEGGHFAPLVAEGQDGVRAVMLLAGTTEPFEVGLIAQLERLAQIRRRQLDFLASINIALATRKYRGCFDRLEGPGYQPDEMCLGGGVTQRALKEYRAMSLRVPELLRAAPYAIMAVQGSVDRNIDPLEIPRVARLCAGRDVETHYVEGVDHPLTNAMKPAALDDTVKARIATFLASVGR